MGDPVQHRAGVMKRWRDRTDVNWPLFLVGLGILIILFGSVFFGEVVKTVNNRLVTDEERELYELWRKGQEAPLSLTSEEWEALRHEDLLP